MSEADPNIFPRMDVLPGMELLRKVGRVAGSLLVPFHCQAEDYMSDHYRGGAAMLDRELYDKPQQLELDWPPTRQQLQAAVSRWDDMGNYLND